MESEDNNAKGHEFKARQKETPLLEVELHQTSSAEPFVNAEVIGRNGEGEPKEVDEIRQGIEELGDGGEVTASVTAESLPANKQDAQTQRKIPANKGIMFVMFGDVKEALQILANPNAGTGRLYELLGGVAKDEMGYDAMNMGFWGENTPKTDNRIIGANREMFRMVAESAGFTDLDQLVVDAGCGNGTNIAQCLRDYPIGRMIGLNLSTGQVEIGNHYLKTHDLASRGELIEASATKMPFESGSVNKMVSVEAAFHFNSRDDFLAEAFRTLKPGGLLAMSDLIISPPKSLLEKAVLSMAMRSLQIPKSNVYDYDAYLEKIKKAGFSIVSARSIKDKVVPSFRKWFWSQPLKDMFNHNLILGTASFGFVFYPWDYLHVVAKKE